jgi:predicted alpha/beta-fold hydrolase
VLAVFRLATSNDESMNETFSWVLSKDFRPHLLLSSGHAQTIYAGLGAATKLPYLSRCHAIPTTDGDQLALHEDVPREWRKGGLSSLLVHGLGGSHRSPYVARIANKLRARGVRTYRLDMRGCGAGDQMAQKTAHAGRSQDVAAAVDFILTECPESSLVVVGFSLGANQVLKMLGEWGNSAPSCLLRAMAVAPPIDLLACAKNIARPSRFAYNRWFVRSLVRDARRRAAWVPALADIDWTRPPKTLYEFDDRVTAPVNGFSGAEHYYTCSSSSTWLQKIQRPTLILAARDDPIVPGTIFQNLVLGDQVALHMTKHGGHVGYIGRRGLDPDRNWLEWRVVECVIGLQE